MRPATTLIPLYLLAPAVLGSPIPLVLVGHLEAILGASHPPAPVAASRPKHALPEVIVFDSEDDGGHESPFDNRPLTPAATAQPSVVLASHRPIATEYLLSLTHNPWMRGKGEAPKVVKLPADAVAAIESSSITQIETGMGAEEVDAPVVVARIGMPCYHARLLPGHNDVLAVSLIFIFIAVVVVVEIFSSATRLLSKRGAIRLEDDTSNERQKQPLSVQSNSTDALSEKPTL